MSAGRIPNQKGGARAFYKTCPCIPSVLTQTPPTNNDGEQGPETDQKQIRKLMKEVHKGRASSMTVTNYKKDGRPFRNLVHVYPLSSDSSNDVTHMLGTSWVVAERVVGR